MSDLSNDIAEEGFIMFPKKMCKALCRCRLGGNTRSVFDVILIQTVGWRKEWDYIALSQFAEKTGIAKPNVCREIQTLVGRKIIFKKISKGHTNQYAINLNYEQWKGLSDLIPIIKTDNEDIEDEQDYSQNGEEEVSDQRDTKEAITEEPLQENLSSRESSLPVRSDTHSQPEIIDAEVLDEESGEKHEGTTLRELFAGYNDKG